jgi:prepilin-type processing-associated H-X9-DG protein
LNIAAGYRNTKGMPILLAEYRKWAIFPEMLKSTRGTGIWPQDPQARWLRLRHGPPLKLGVLEMASYRDTSDRTYVAKTRANCGFLDGHVELIPAMRLYNLYAVPTNKKWTPSLWLGPRPANPADFKPVF